MHMENDQQYLSMQDAADLCNVNRATISRRRKKGHFPSAYRAENGAWHISVADLIAAGLTPERVQTPSDLHAEITALRAQLVQETARADHAEELAEIQKQHLQDWRETVIRQLGPAPANESTGTGEKRKPRFWRRTKTS